MQNINVNIVPDNFPQTIRYSQGDIGRQFKINVTDFDIPVGATVKIQATKPSGFGFSVAGVVADNSVTFTTTAEMTDEAGRFQAELQITAGDDVIGTANFLMIGERNPHPEGTTDGSQGTIIPELTLLVERVEKAASDVLDMEVVATTLPAGSQATYSYDEDLNKATFGIPEGQAGAGAAGVVASAYSAAKTYKVGDYVLYNSNLYRCTTAITTAEAWTAAHWTQVVLADDVTDLKTDLQEAIDEFAVPTQEAVDNWLEAHPEATTTVEDHSLSIEKMIVGTLGYVTPEMFGAEGDGNTDDSTALQSMFNSGIGNYFLENTYAITTTINVSGNIFGKGKIISKDAGRIIGGFFNVVGDTHIKGITFDCYSSIEYQSTDYGTELNCAINSQNNGYNLYVDSVNFIRGYASAFIYLYALTGYISIKKCTFKALGTNNQWSGYMIYMVTITGTESIDIIGNSFYGNGNASSNFAGIFMSGITTREKINIGRNLFNGVGRNKTGGHQSHCIDCYWNVSHLNAFENTMINNAYCCLRIHGGSDYDIHDNYFGSPNSLTTDACVLVQDDKSSTGSASIGVSNVKIRNNTFKATERYENAIQLTSGGSDLNGSIDDVVIQNNDIEGVYNWIIAIDGSVKEINVSNNTLKSTRGGFGLFGGTFAFTSATILSMIGNFFEIKGGSAITPKDANGDITMKVVNNYFRTYNYAVKMLTVSDHVSAYNNVIVGTKGFDSVPYVGGNILEITAPSEGVVNATKNFDNYINGNLAT